ncbi:Programmed cell death protein 2 [Linum perenne]
MEGTSAGGDGVEDLKGLRISSLDSDEDDAFEEGSRKLDVEDDDDEEDDEEVETVMLGFLEKPEHPWSLHRQSFPSKAGGAPAWLDPVNLPSGNRSLCDTCGKPLRFVLQVYAPITEKESTYHRTLFVFMCSKMSCLLRDQHEQWKRKPEQQSRRYLYNLTTFTLTSKTALTLSDTSMFSEVSRFSVASCLLAILFTQVRTHEMMVMTSLLDLELCSVTVVVLGKEIKFVVDARKHTIAQKGISVNTGNQNTNISVAKWKIPCSNPVVALVMAEQLFLKFLRRSCGQNTR